ncbi:cell division protein CrgA [Lysinibacter sp. HNR]|uniref:cell division protein CrgA n=1 Tax=Lysinibacter sp. HNR TaxID=3031408 RepID=UPI0024357005|nr:cell division protein CrgA [Lysinibacter sp. HNR]WGD37356.1 cell division protein CrgA [Lysinibacter sp. HNR]
MAASKEVRKKKSDIEKSRPETKTPRGEDVPNPVWFKPMMFGFMLLGLIWIIVFYLSAGASLPIPALGQSNIFVGFGIMFIGFLMATRWR